MILSRFAAATVAAFITVSATAADVKQQVEGQLDLRSLFERAPGVAAKQGDVTETPRSVEVLLARVGPDGELIKACVDSEAAARRFFDAPIETLHTKQAKEQ